MAPAPFLSMRGVDYSYPGSPAQILRDLTVSFTAGFNGIAGPNGAGKTTLLQLACGLLKPDGGQIEGGGQRAYCAQRTDVPPAGFADMLDDTGAPVYALRSRLGIEWDWLQRWTSLSHGERKRAQIGCALWQRPDVLAIDEPTNHLDTSARRILLNALREYPGVCLIVSHDRDLLDELCHQCLWLGNEQATLYSGGYTSMLASRDEAQLSAQRTRARALRQRNALQREAVVRREQDARAHRARSKRHIDKKDHSAKAAVDAKRVADSKDGARLRQLGGRISQAEQAAEQARVEKTHAIGIEMPGVVCRRDSLLNIAHGKITLANERTLSHPDLRIRPADRVAVTGNNGTGKSTLLRRLVKRLNVDPARVVVMPQELTAAEGAEILAAAKSLSPAALGHAMNVVSCLGSRPAKLLDSRTPSPGELRKLLLAVGMTREPYLLVLDEPTNHLDLPSMSALEAALAACGCGLLMVSHDNRFLEGLTDVRWHIEADPNGQASLNVSH